MDAIATSAPVFNPGECALVQLGTPSAYSLDQAWAVVIDARNIAGVGWRYLIRVGTLVGIAHGTGRQDIPLRCVRTVRGGTFGVIDTASAKLFFGWDN